MKIPSIEQTIEALDAVIKFGSGLMIYLAVALSILIAVRMLLGINLVKELEKYLMG